MAREEERKGKNISIHHALGKERERRTITPAPTSDWKT